MTKENIVFAIVALIMVVVAYFGASSFFELVGDLYSWLDQYIWAFFAGIIAFFMSLWVVAMMVQISIVLITILLVLISSIFSR